MLNNLSVENLYFYGLVICSIVSLILFFLGDILNFDGPVDPVLLVPWGAFISLFGFAGEYFTKLSSLFIFLCSVVLSIMLIFILNFYVLIPLKRAETSLSSSEKNLEGRIATVITTIPKNGVGEIQISNVTGSIFKPAKLFGEELMEVKRGEEVLIIEIENRVCYVKPYQKNFVV